MSVTMCSAADHASQLPAVCVRACVRVRDGATAMPRAYYRGTLCVGVCPSACGRRGSRAQASITLTRERDGSIHYVPGERPREGPMPHVRVNTGVSPLVTARHADAPRARHAMRACEHRVGAAHALGSTLQWHDAQLQWDDAQL
eukprot:5728214-Prymnesium_polylepis.1